ncbi:MAG: hypothetical protein FWG72_08250 [Oscillospiraceae bacterium]|nr:hypothetical protein [Oscillospiraceae bacterium]
MTAIKQGIITPTTKETLLKLEQDKEDAEINVAKGEDGAPNPDKRANQILDMQTPPD